MIYLSEHDVHTCCQPLDMVDAVERGLMAYADGTVHVPPRTHIERDGNTLLLMPSLGPSVFGIKLVSVFPDNASRGEPVIHGVMMLNDGTTGRPLAVIDGRTLTAVRTGALGAAAVRHLAPPGASTLGLVGAGVQGLEQVLFISRVRPITHLYVHDRDPGRSAALQAELERQLPDLKVCCVGSAEDVLDPSEIIVTATTSQHPVLPDSEDLLRGRCFVGIGSFRPAMREFPEALFRAAGEIYVDTEHSVEESGDVLVPLDKGWVDRTSIRPLGQLLKDAGPWPSPGSTVLFKSVGMAALDLAVAEILYIRAVESGTGLSL